MKKWREDKAYGGGVAGADPGGQDAGAGGKDVDDGAVVGEGGAGVGAGGGADGAGKGLVGGGGVGGVGVVVTGGDGEEDAGVDDGASRRVDGGRGATTERHVGDSAVGAAAGLGVGDDSVHAGDDSRAVGEVSVSCVEKGSGGQNSRGAGSVGAEDLDGVELGELSNTVLGATDGAGDVGAVAIAISAGATGVVAEPRGTAAEVLSGPRLVAMARVIARIGGTYGVGGVDTSVDNVRASSGTGAAVVGVAGGRSSVGAGELAQAPGGTGLGDVGADLVDLLLLDVFDLWARVSFRFPLRGSCSAGSLPRKGCGWPQARRRRSCRRFP